MNKATNKSPSRCSKLILNTYLIKNIQVSLTSIAFFYLSLYSLAMLSLATTML